MRKVELLPTRNAEASYAPDYSQPSVYESCAVPLDHTCPQRAIILPDLFGFSGGKTQWGIKGAGPLPNG